MDESGRHDLGSRAVRETLGMTDGSGAGLNTLLEFVRESRGFDFTGYKRSSIERRVTKRMNEVGIAAGRYDDYVDYLELNAEEFAELFNTLLINVTAFFRDAAIWEQMATKVLPDLLANRAGTDPIRVWCAGCSSGEEPYTVAMVLARILGDDAFRDRVKVYATDVDEEALDQARRGAYLPRQLEEVPRDALERFFQRTDGRYVFRKDLRRCVIFGGNDLVRDAPISRIDLLVCRNTLMYFTAETQAQILRRFHFALDEDGVLLLGKSEMPITHGDLFTAVDLRWRVFRKVVRPALRERLRAMVADPENGASQSVVDGVRELAFDLSGPATVVLDAVGSVVMANEEARRTFGLHLTDFGRPIQDLELSYRPLELRSHLDAIGTERRATEIKAVRWRHHDAERVFDVRLVPLMGDGTQLGTSVSYVDVTHSHKLSQQLTSSREELEQAYEELQSTVEELETANEELETTNEELQSSNEELETMNGELRQRMLELNDLNTFLETVLTAMGVAVLVLDRREYVQIWNQQARELWGLTAEEVEDQHVLSLDIGLPLQEIKSSIQACLNGHRERHEVIVAAVDRRGRSFQCRVTCLPLGPGRGGDVTGVIVMMEPAEDGRPS